MVNVHNLHQGAELLKYFVEIGRLKIQTLETTAKVGLKESEMALEMLEEEGFKI